MVGMLLWKTPQAGKREKAVIVKERSILHVRFMCAEILRGPKTPEAVLRRRIATAGKRLRKLGASQLVLPEEFPYVEQLKKWELHPVSTLSLRRAIAADWVRWSLEARGEATTGARIAVSAQRLTGEVVRTVTELSLRHRYVLLDVPHGGEELCRQLRREYGVSLLLGPSKEQMEGAEVLVLFDTREDCQSPAALRLYEETVPLPPLLLPPALEEKLPSGSDRGQLLTTLRENGALRPGQIVVGGAILTK